MTSRRRSLLIVAALLLMLGGGAAVILLVEGFRWRAQVATMKLSGDVADLSWGELARMLRPGSPYYLRPLLDNGNQCGGAGRRFGSTALALSVHSPRRARLGFQPDSSSG